MSRLREILKFLGLGTFFMAALVLSGLLGLFIVLSPIFFLEPWLEEVWHIPPLLSVIASFVTSSALFIAGIVACCIYQVQRQRTSRSM